MNWKTVAIIPFAIASLFGTTQIKTVAAKENQALFETYHQAISQKYGIDINNFKQQISGGEADEHPLTKYKLKQILLGIKVELEHTDNKYKALEITTDHLEEIPDYYTRLLRMEKLALAEQPQIETKKALADKSQFESYRKAISQKYGIDLNNFEQQITGGEADEHPITKYNLEQILLGIEVEMEHTDNKYKALEITTDHLEEIPDYYTRLLKMEEEAFANPSAITHNLI